MTPSERYDYISFLGHPRADEAQAIRRLMLQEPPDPLVGYPELYVCPECADLGCGGITVKVERSDGQYTWCEFAYENPWVPSMTETATLEAVREVLGGLGPYHFAEAAYEEALAYAAALTNHGVLRVNTSDSGPV